MKKKISSQTLSNPDRSTVVCDMLRAVQSRVGKSTGRWQYWQGRGPVTCKEYRRAATIAIQID